MLSDRVNFDEKGRMFGARGGSLMEGEESLAGEVKRVFGIGGKLGGRERKFGTS